MIATDNREVLVVNPALEIVARMDVETRPVDVALSRSGAALIAALGEALTGFDPQSGRSRWSVGGSFVACHASAAGLWAAESLHSEIELSVRDESSGAVRAATKVRDRFGGSAVMLLPHPSERSIVVWVAAGQDGQIALLATHRGEGIETTALPPPDRIPPVFLPDGNSYLSGGDDVLEQYACPVGNRIGVVAWPTDDADEDGSRSGSYVHILPGSYATWSSDEGRVHIVDLENWSIVDELTISGHPLRTVEELYPSLQGDRMLCTDFHFSTPGPDGLILTVHGKTELVVSAIADWSPDPTRKP